MKTVLCTLLALCPIFLSSSISHGTTPEKKGLEIAIETDNIDRGFHDQKSNMKMVLRDRQGRESVREIKSFTLEVENDGNKSLIQFEQPRTVKGTRFLSFTHKTGPDDQWLYLPKIKRIKRIASNNKSGPFMGSEFAYEDIASQEVEKYTYLFLRNEKCGDLQCHVIKRYPVDKNSGYSKQIVWIVQGNGNFRPVKIHYFDKKGSHLKSLEFLNYKKYLGKYWRPLLMKMVNHVTQKSTDLIFSNYEFKTGLTKRDFDKKSLKR